MGWPELSGVSGVDIGIGGSCPGMGSGTRKGSGSEAGVDPVADPKGPTGTEGGPAGQRQNERSLSSLWTMGMPEGAGVM